MRAISIHGGCGKIFSTVSLRIIYGMFNDDRYVHHTSCQCVDVIIGLYTFLTQSHGSNVVIVQRGMARIK